MQSSRALCPLYFSLGGIGLFGLVGTVFEHWKFGKAVLRSPWAYRKILCVTAGFASAFIGAHGTPVELNERTGGDDELRSEHVSKDWISSINQADTASQAVRGNNASGAPPDAVVYAITQDPKGHYLVGGIFQRVGVFARPLIARLSVSAETDHFVLHRTGVTHGGAEIACFMRVLCTHCSSCRFGVCLLASHTAVGNVVGERHRRAKSLHTNRRPLFPFRSHGVDRGLDRWAASARISHQQ